MGKACTQKAFNKDRYELFFEHLKATFIPILNVFELFCIISDSILIFVAQPDIKKTSQPENSKEQEIPKKSVLEPIQLIARSREGIYLIDDFTKDYQKDETKIICSEGNISFFNSDGTLLAVWMTFLLLTISFPIQRKLDFTCSMRKRELHMN